MTHHTSSRRRPPLSSGGSRHGTAGRTKVRLRVRLATLIGPTHRTTGTDPRTSRARHGRDRNERGSATAFLVVLAVALLAVAGLVIDGGYTLGAQRKAMNHAEQAARVGSDALTESSLRSGGTVSVNPSKAVNDAQGYLHSVGAKGTVSVNGGEVTVTVTGSQDTTLLSAVGVNSLDFKATATAISIDEDNP